MTVCTYSYVATHPTYGAIYAPTIHTPSVDDAGAAAIVNQIAALTFDSISLLWGTHFSTVQPSGGGPGPAQPVGTVARLQLEDTNGNPCVLIIPNPSPTIYLADGYTVDPSAVSALITALQAHGCSQAGYPIAALIAGRRTQGALPQWPKF